MKTLILRYLLVGVTALSLSPTAFAQEPAGAHLSMELNAAQSEEQSCKLSFLVINGRGSDILKAVFETVLFDAQGQVDRLTLFDFGALPAGRPRVRQFVVSGTRCEYLGQILFNGVNTCEAEDMDATACESGLQLNSRTTIKVTG